MPLDGSDYLPWADANLTAEQRKLWTGLLAWLDAGGDDDIYKFDYKNWTDWIGCGTSCCIGGWLDSHLDVDTNFCTQDELMSIISKGIGIPVSVADDLFYGAAPGGVDFWLHDEVEYDAVDLPSASEAAACVRHLLQTGVVDWSRARAESRASEVSKCP